MKLVFEEIISTRPAILGRDLLKRAGFSGHYVDERDIADFLGYEIKEVSPDSYDIPNLGEILDTASAHLIPEFSLIVINKDMPKVHKRMSIFHESGHETNPLHRASALSCSKKDLEPTAHKQMEKEAFLCGAEVMFPLKPFVDDSSSAALGLDSIEKISRRYTGSLEATAIRYARTNQNVMALMVVQPMAVFLAQSSVIAGNHKHPDLPFKIQNINKPNGRPPAPLRVQYFVPAYRFPKYISSGTEIREGNIIFDTWKTGVKTTGEIPAAALGSSDRCNYFVECTPFGNDGRIMVLLWLHNKQSEFWRGIL